MDTNQDAPPPGGSTTDPLPERAAFEPDSETARAERVRVAADVAGTVRTGLRRWTLIVALGSIAALLLHRPDAALFLSLAALFALAQSWDRLDRARTGDPVVDAPLEPGEVGAVLRVLVPWVAPCLGALLFAGFAMLASSMPATGPRVAAVQWCVAAAGASLLVAHPAVSIFLARKFVRGSHPGHTARLTTSIALVVVLLPVPFQLLSDDWMAFMTEDGRPLVDVGSLLGQMAGELLFALAAVGLWVARDLRAARERLGLGGLTARHVLIAAAGLVAVIGGNAGLEWIEQARFHDLWLRDQEMVRRIAGNIGLGTALVLGVSAGVGEEILVRGALQPRVGLLWASLLFAAAHVQYTWFGMLTIVVLGVILGFVKQRANTTTAIVVHVIYDIFAALGSR